MNFKKILFLPFIFAIFLMVIFYFFGENLIQIGISKEEVVVFQPIIKYEIPEHVKIPILIYHHIRDFRASDSQNDQTFIVSALNFEKQMDYLKENGYKTLTFADFKDIFAGKKRLPQKSVIITFDDGLKTQFNSAYRILKANNQKAVFFIFTNPISKSKNYMSWEDLLEMKEYGMEIGSHGHYHSNFNKLTEEFEWERELGKNRELIKENLGEYPQAIAYPFGEYSDSVIQYIKEYDYEFARAITHGKKHGQEDFYQLDGYFVTSDFNYFKNIVSL